MSSLFARLIASWRRHPARVVGGVAMVLTVAGVGITATPAFAHHPEVTASVDCRGLVSFTSTAWSTTDSNRRINASIGVSYSTNGGGAFTDLPLDPAYHYGADNNYTFSDTFQLATPLPATVIVKVTALAGWGPSGNLAAPGGTRQTLALTRPTCPAAPSASIADVDCAAHGVVVTLTNGGEAAATFTVVENDELIDTVAVAGGATITKTYPLAEDQTATIKVTAPGMDDVVRTLTRNCEQPRAHASVSCSAGGAYLTFGNDGDSPTTFTVDKGDTQVEQVDVAGHGNAARTYPITEGETATFTVTSSGGMSDIVADLTFDCRRPSATISDVDCAAQGVTATFTNDGELPVSFTVRKDDAIVDSVEVAGGATEARTYPVREDATATFTISAPGMHEVSRDVARKCEQPAAEITDSCVDGGAVVGLTNDGASTTTFTIAKNGHTIDTVNVAGHSTARRTYPLAEDETATFTLGSPGGMADVERTITHDCDQPVTTTTTTTTPPRTTTPTTPAPPRTPPETKVAPASTSRALGATAGQHAAAGNQETLPFTGGAPLPLAVAGLGLLVFGGVLVRRKRTKSA